MHFSPQRDIGDWLSLWGRGELGLHVNDRIFDPYYQAGYALEILIEAGIFFGSLYLLARRKSVTDLPAVNDEARAVDERSAVRK